ncbi:MAG: hypothetical protein Q7I89_00285 [Syntrophales bacterium]|nr:hypothetical protein [Syntrophales bacterium]
MVFDGFISGAFFGDEFYGRAEEFVKESPFTAVEVIEEGDDLGLI